MSPVRTNADPDPVRQDATLAAARLNCRHPEWDIRPVRVSRGWSVEAVPAEGDGGTSAVIGTAEEIEDVIKAAQRGKG